MLYLADLVFVTHIVFLLFIGLGVVLVWRWPALAWVHLPTLLWSLVIACHPGTECPLTPLEKHLLRLAGQPAYEGPFLDHYVTPWILRHAQEFGLALAVTNGVVYGVLIWQRASKQAHR